MGYRELLSSINCKLVVIIEDDFKQIEYKKKRVLYDIMQIAIGDRRQYLSEIETVSPVLHEILSKFLSLFDKCSDKIGVWDDKIPYENISCAFALIGGIDPKLKRQIEEQYVLFEGETAQKVYEIGVKYGIGINHPSNSDELYDDYVLSKNRAQSIRIYTGFSAETQRLFSVNIEQASPECVVVCIVDNYVSGANRAKEVIEVISEKCSTTHRNIIESIFSSREMYEEISDKLYFEYASREKPEELKSCIARSAYSCFISELKNETPVSMSTALDKVLKNKGTAFFLAQEVRTEGASGYEIINDWVRLLATTPREDTNTVKRVICLSRVINSLEDTEELSDTDLQKLDTLEAFGYTINGYFLPVAADDVFTSNKGEWFTLIGQDCDMARSITRTPKNASAKLLPTEIRHQAEFDKWANDLRSTSIYSSRKTIDVEYEVLQVEYQSRQYIANGVLNLCSLNSDG